jgi:glutamine amidotransferase
LAELGCTLRELLPALHRHGTFNMLLSNGQALWAHGSTKLHWLLRQHPFRTAALRDEDLQVNFASHTTPSDRVAIIATEPLTADEAWTAFAPGELKVFVDGVVAD